MGGGTALLADNVGLGACVTDGRAVGDWAVGGWVIDGWAVGGWARLGGSAVAVARSGRFDGAKFEGAKFEGASHTGIDGDSRGSDDPVASGSVGNGGAIRDGGAVGDSVGRAVWVGSGGVSTQVGAGGLVWASEGVGAAVLGTGGPPDPVPATSCPLSSMSGTVTATAVAIDATPATMPPRRYWRRRPDVTTSSLPKPSGGSSAVNPRNAARMSSSSGIVITHLSTSGARLCANPAGPRAARRVLWRTRSSPFPR